MTRILIAGFQHETNTFAPSLADWAAFTRGDSFPAFVRGAAMQAQMTGINIPVGGFIENVVVHGFTCEVGEETKCGSSSSSAGGASAPGSGSAAATTTKGPDGVERAWLPRGDALRMIAQEPAVCSPFLLAGKKAWFAA